MKIIVAGRDCTSDLGVEIQRRAANLKKRKGRAAPPRISQEIGALTLAKANSNSDYLNHFIRLLRYRDAFDTYDFDIPRKPGLFGLLLARLKVVLWKLLRYQHDRIAFRQNLINGLFTNAIEFEMAEMERMHADLCRRLDSLEAALKKPAAGQKEK